MKGYWTVRQCLQQSIEIVGNFFTKRIILYSKVDVKFALILRYIEMTVPVASCAYKICTVIRINFVEHTEEGGRRL